MNDNLTAVKSNALIEAGYKLTLQEQRVLLVCIGKLNSMLEGQESTIKLTAKELYQAFPDMGREHAERHLRSGINRLAERWIYLRNEEIEQEIRWIQSKARYLKGEARCEITFSNAIMPYLTQLKGQFTKIAVRNVSALKSVYSIRLYELLMQFKAIGDRIIKVDDFRVMMGVSDKYKEFRDLNKRVIIPAITELNQKSDLQVTMDIVKDGRSVAALHFHFQEDRQIKINA